VTDRVRALLITPDDDLLTIKRVRPGQGPYWVLPGDSRLAKRYRWHSIVLVATPPQDTRARLRLGRCFGGKIYVVG
jgi:hypothetical protein